jgi:hypothetical protein
MLQLLASKYCSKRFLEDFCNNPKPFDIHSPFQTEISNDWNLKFCFNNIVVGIICLNLGDMNHSWMETEHCTQTFLYDM